MKAISILSFTACFLFGGSAIADEMSLIYKFKDWEIRTNGQTLIFGTEGNGKTFSFFGFVTKKGDCFSNLSPYYITTSMSSSSKLEKGAYVLGSLFSEKSQTTLNFQVVGYETEDDAKGYILSAGNVTKDAVDAIVEHDSLMVQLQEPKGELGDLAGRFEVFSLQGSKATILKALDTCNLMTEGKSL